MPEGWKIRKSQWGYTLYAANGRPVAHAAPEHRPLLVDYAKGCC